MPLVIAAAAVLVLAAVVVLVFEHRKPTSTVSPVNAATDSLGGYVAQISRQGDPSAALARYQDAISFYQRQAARANQLAQRAGANSADVKSAQAAAEAAALQRDTLKQKYEATELAPVTSVIVMQRATSATNDKRSKIELLGILGLVAGALVGTALALARANRTLMRRRARV